MELLVSTCAVRNGRRKMEDKHVVIHDLNAQCNLNNTQKRYSLYAVYDGHGGVDAANFCADNLHQILCKTRSFNEGNIEKALRETFKETDRLFCSSLLKTQSGCTAVVCLREIVDEPDKQVKLYFAWAGDSQAVLVRDGRAMDVTPPHKPDDEKEITRIESLGGVVVKSDCYRVNGLLAVSRAIGDASHKPYITSEPDIRVETMQGNEDFLILACDGIWDEIDCDDATQLVYESIQDSSDADAAAKSIASYLVENAKNQGSADNITVIVVFLRSLQDIFPTASFKSDSPKMIVNNKDEKEPTLFEPVQLRVKNDGNLIQGDDVGVTTRVAGDSVNAFKNGLVAFPTTLYEDPLPQEVKLPSPTSQCLADSYTTETMKSESPSSILTLNREEEAIPHPIKPEVNSNMLTTTSSCFVTPPTISQHDLLQFSFHPQQDEESQKSGQTVISNTTNTEKDMESNQIFRSVFSPVYSSFESKSEEIKIEEELEETTVITETLIDPIPMTRTTEKIFTSPKSTTSLLHELSEENRRNGGSTTPTTKVASKESYSLSSPSGNEKVSRVFGDFTNPNHESLSRKENSSQDILQQVKETKVFDVDSDINKTSATEPLVRVHQVIVEANSERSEKESCKKNEIGNHYTNGRKELRNEVNQSVNSSETRLQSLMESNIITTSSDVASSSFQTSSNEFNRAFLDFDSSQNASKDELSMKDFSPNQNGKHLNNDYLTLLSAKGDLCPETKVRESCSDMDLISESITRLTTNEGKKLSKDPKPLSSASDRTLSPKRVPLATVSSKSKEVSKVKALPAARPKISSTRQPISKTEAKTVAFKPSTATGLGNRTGLLSKPTKTVPSKVSVARSTLTTTAKLVEPLAKPTSTVSSTRPVSRSVPVTKVGARSGPSTTKLSTLNAKSETQKPLATNPVTKVKPATTSTVSRVLPVRPTSTLSKPAAPLKSSLLTRTSVSTSVLKPVVSKVDSGLTSSKTVRLNPPASSGLKSSSTSALRGIPTNPIMTRTGVRKVEISKPPTRVSPTKNLKKIVPDTKLDETRLKTQPKP